MYIPASFQEANLPRLHDFIESHAFGLLISSVDALPFATHLPFLLERGAGPFGHLVGHLARANPHGHDLDGSEVLALFSGPHAYISPTWYEAENVVPTWNYVAVHAYGICRQIDDPASLADILRTSVATFEAGFAAPWQLETDSEFFSRLVQGIIGFRIEITRLEGKWKLSQNHPRERRDKVIRALEASPDSNEREIAAMMRDQNER
jgi:transcriptional regulator